MWTETRSVLTKWCTQSPERASRSCTRTLKGHPDNTNDCPSEHYFVCDRRMLLADVLALASRKVKKPGEVHESLLDELSPKVVIDFATLTGFSAVRKSDSCTHLQFFSGTCISSLSNRYIGVFSNRMESLAQLFIDAGVSSGERAW